MCCLSVSNKIKGDPEFVCPLMCGFGPSGCVRCNGNKVSTINEVIFLFLEPKGDVGGNSVRSVARILYATIVRE